LAQLERYTWVALTSANAARAVAAALRAGPPGLRIAAVGPRTAACLREHGLPVALCAGDNAEADTAATAEGLCAALLALWRREGRAAGAERVLLPRAAEGREALAAGLAAAGVAVTAVTAYQMAPAEPAALAPLAPLLAAGGVDLVPFGSPRSADLVLDALGTAGPHLLRRFAVGAMGTTTKTALRARGVQVDASALAPATFAGLLDALAAVHWQRRRAGDEKS
jgi:uroporphyrinogen-III synthase